MKKENSQRKKSMQLEAMNREIRYWFFLGSLLFLMSCSSVEYTAQPQFEYIGSDERNEIRKVVVFFDGTANDESSRTNVAKLHNLVSLQARRDIHTIYIKGVGTGGSPAYKVLGMGVGLGIGKDVRQAYDFIVNRMDPEEDELYLFGFSRGAYAARILAGMLEVAGIVALEACTAQNAKVRKRCARRNKSLIKDIYSAYKGNGSVDERRVRVRRVTGKIGRPVDISFLGLWDTVATIGIPNNRETLGEVEPKYLDQLCNIKRAAHALALDDNRARLYTPVLLTQKHLIKYCMEVDIHDVVSELWFSGAHSDVGGGYHDTDISGVSLNWMLGEIREHQLDLIPDDTVVFENVLGKSHNPDEGILGRILYWTLNRNLPLYVKEVEYPDGRLPIHASVPTRLATAGVGKKWHEFNWIAETPVRNYPDCFDDVTNTEKQSVSDCHAKYCTLKMLPLEQQTCFRVESTNLPSSR